MSSSGSARFDAVVIGAGHNGLTAAALLAEQGQRVIVVEARESVGGLAAGEEFHPGYRHAGILHDTSGVRPWAVRALDLESHGLARRAPAELLVPQIDGPGLVLSGAGAPGASWWTSSELPDGEHEALTRCGAFLERIAPALRRFLDQPPPEVFRTGRGGLLRLATSALALRRLGKRDMTEVLRILPMPAADWLGERFGSELLTAALAGPAVYSTYSGPRSPGSNANLVLAAAVAGRPVAGGPRGLIAALESSARTLGVEVRCAAPVRRILLEDPASDSAGRPRVSGVELSDGERIEAPLVAASCDPRQSLLELLPPGVLAKKLEADLLSFRSRGTAAKIHLALTGYPEFSSRPGAVLEHVRTGESLDELERAFDAVKYRRMSERPVLDVVFPTVETPELAPPGHHVASILVSFAPYALEGGWTREAGDALYTSVVDVLESYAPGIEALIAGREILTPNDLAERFRLTGGHLHHGEHALDQRLIRPVPACSGYATPFGGLFLCGSGSHPGGGITCAPGALAARAV